MQECTQARVNMIIGCIKCQELILDQKTLCVNKLKVFGLGFISFIWRHPRLVSETGTVALEQAGAQANQFTSAIDRAGNITNFTENRAGKETQKRLVLKLLCLS